MLELATSVFRDFDFLKLARPSKDGSATPTDTEPKENWETFLGKEIAKVFGDQGRGYWRWRDERCIDFLTEIFYRHPQIAADIVEMDQSRLRRTDSGTAAQAVFCPKFIRVLSEEPETEQLVVLHESQPRAKPQGPMEGFKEAVRAGGERARRRIATWLQKISIHIAVQRRYTVPQLQVRLLRDPALVRSLAQKLQAAVSFSMVLDAELEEIAKSRSHRLVDDLDAKAAKIAARLCLLREREKELNDEIDGHIKSRSAGGGA